MKAKTPEGGIDYGEITARAYEDVARGNHRSELCARLALTKMFDHAMVSEAASKRLGYPFVLRSAGEAFTLSASADGPRVMFRRDGDRIVIDMSALQAAALSGLESMITWTPGADPPEDLLARAVNEVARAGESLVRDAMRRIRARREKGRG